MAAVRALPALAAALLLAAAGQASKYSREANEGLAAGDGKRREAGEFRVVKLNQVWEKAQRVSGAARSDGGARRGLRGRARPLQTLLAREGDGEERDLCERRRRGCPAWLGAAVASIVFSGMAVPVTLPQRPVPSAGTGMCARVLEVLKCSCPCLNTAAKPHGREAGIEGRPSPDPGRICWLQSSLVECFTELSGTGVAVGRRWPRFLLCTGQKLTAREEGTNAPSWWLCRLHSHRAM